MNRRELNISDKKLHTNTKEDIILKSPSIIPPKELQELSNLRGINAHKYAYYDISQTEHQSIDHLTKIEKTHYNIAGYTNKEGNIIMGEQGDFDYKRVIYSSIAHENKIDNFPGSDYNQNFIELSRSKITINLHKLFKHCINRIYEKFRNNLKLTSVYRNKEVNKILGGVENSQHIYGYAADMILTDNIPTSTLFNWCKFNLPHYHQLIWEYPEKGDYISGDISDKNFSWVHISYIEGDNYKINSISSTDPKIHKSYQDENTFYLDNFTHKISVANQKLLE